VPNLRAVLVIFIVLAVAAAGWLFGAVFVSRCIEPTTGRCTPSALPCAGSAA
jgi:hypothetical protein